MSERFLTKSAVMLMVFNKEKTMVLLQRRKNTGYMDGYWDFGATGHVDADESMKQAIIREAEEELGILIDIKDIHFATLCHKLTSETGTIYYNGYFTCNKYINTPEIKELDKASELKWFKIDSLPSDLIPDRKEAFSQYISNNPYHEIGW